MKLIDTIKTELKNHKIVTEQDEKDYHYKARKYHLCLELDRNDASEKVMEQALRELTPDNFQFVLKKYKGRR